MRAPPSAPLDYRKMLLLLLATDPMAGNPLMTTRMVFADLLKHRAVYIGATMMRIAFGLSFGFFMICLTGSALADKPLSNMAKEKMAKKACATGDFVKGVDILADLFVDTNDYLYVYNQGRCYQQNSRWEQAIGRFREYLRKAKDIPGNDRTKTERQIADCELSMGKPSQLEPRPVAEPLPSPTHPAPLHPATEPVTSAVSGDPEPLPSASDRGKGLRVAGIISTAVGVAAVGTGVGMALKANSLSTTKYSRSREDERASLKTWGLISYGVGAAAIVTGMVLYLAGWPSEPSTGMALLPVMSNDGASMFLKGEF